VKIASSYNLLNFKRLFLTGVAGKIKNVNSSFINFSFQYADCVFIKEDKYVFKAVKQLIEQVFVNIL
jgi:hypothetical protein